MGILVPSSKDSVRTVSADYVPATIQISVSDRSGEDPDWRLASGFVRGFIELKKRRDYFQLLERRPVTISGVEGELSAFVEEWVVLAARDTPKLRYVRWAYFDYDGLVWEIEAEAEEELAEQVRVDFEHVLETFKILD